MNVLIAIIKGTVAISLIKIYNKLSVSLQINAESINMNI
jgi:hypothetical protein